jgi:hypothetical protein
MKCLHEVGKTYVLPLFNTLLEIHALVPLHAGGWDLAHEILVDLIAKGGVCTSDIGGMVKVVFFGRLFAPLLPSLRAEMTPSPLFLQICWSLLELSLDEEEIRNGHLAHACFRWAGAIRRLLRLISCLSSSTSDDLVNIECILEHCARHSPDVMHVLVEILISTLCDGGREARTKNGVEGSEFWLKAPFQIDMAPKKEEQLECGWQDLVISLVLLRSHKQFTPHNAFPTHLAEGAGEINMRGYNQGGANHRINTKISNGSTVGSEGGLSDFKDRLHHLMYLVVGGYATNSMVKALSANGASSEDDDVEQQAVVAFLEMINDIGASHFESDSQARLLVLAEEMLAWLAFSSHKLVDVATQCDGSESFLRALSSPSTCSNSAWNVFQPTSIGKIVVCQIFHMSNESRNGILSLLLASASDKTAAIDTRYVALESLRMICLKHPKDVVPISHRLLDWIQSATTEKLILDAGSPLTKKMWIPQDYQSTENLLSPPWAAIVIASIFAIAEHDSKFADQVIIFIRKLAMTKDTFFKVVAFSAIVASMAAPRSFGRSGRLASSENSKLCPPSGASRRDLYRSLANIVVDITMSARAALQPRLLLTLSHAFRNLRRWETKACDSPSQNLQVWLDSNVAFASIVQKSILDKFEDAVVDNPENSNSKMVVEGKDLCLDVTGCFHWFQAKSTSRGGAQQLEANVRPLLRLKWPYAQGFHCLCSIAEFVMSLPTDDSIGCRDCSLQEFQETSLQVFDTVVNSLCNSSIAILQRSAQHILQNRVTALCHTNAKKQPQEQTLATERKNNRVLLKGANEKLHSHVIVHAMHLLSQLADVGAIFSETLSNAPNDQMLGPSLTLFELSAFLRNSSMVLEKKHGNLPVVDWIVTREEIRAGRRFKVSDLAPLLGSSSDPGKDGQNQSQGWNHPTSTIPRDSAFSMLCKAVEANVQGREAAEKKRSKLSSSSLSALVADNGEPEAPFECSEEVITVFLEAINADFPGNVHSSSDDFSQLFTLLKNLVLITNGVGGVEGRNMNMGGRGRSADDDDHSTLKSPQANYSSGSKRRRRDANAYCDSSDDDEECQPQIPVGWTYRHLVRMKRDRSWKVVCEEIVHANLESSQDRYWKYWAEVLQCTSSLTNAFEKLVGNEKKNPQQERETLPWCQEMCEVFDELPSSVKNSFFWLFHEELYTCFHLDLSSTSKDVDVWEYLKTSLCLVAHVDEDEHTVYLASIITILIPLLFADKLRQALEEGLPLQLVQHYMSVIEGWWKIANALATAAGRSPMSFVKKEKTVVKKEPGITRSKSSCTCTEACLKSPVSANKICRCFFHRKLHSRLQRSVFEIVCMYKIQQPTLLRRCLQFSLKTRSLWKCECSRCRVSGTSSEDSNLRCTESCNVWSWALQSMLAALYVTDKNSISDRVQLGTRRGPCHVATVICVLNFVEHEVGMVTERSGRGNEAGNERSSQLHIQDEEIKLQQWLESASVATSLHNFEDPEKGAEVDTEDPDGASTAVEHIKRTIQLCTTCDALSAAMLLTELFLMCELHRMNVDLPVSGKTSSEGSFLDSQQIRKPLIGVMMSMASCWSVQKFKVALSEPKKKASPSMKSPSGKKWNGAAGVKILDSERMVLSRISNMLVLMNHWMAKEIAMTREASASLPARFKGLMFRVKKYEMGASFWLSSIRQGNPAGGLLQNDIDMTPTAGSSISSVNSSGKKNRKKRPRRRLRSRNAYIDSCLEGEDGTDSFVDLEDFIET